MDKETLSNYGWIVICVLVLAVMIALAGPFGQFISEAVQSTTKGLFDVNQNALNSTGLINIDRQEFESCEHTYENYVCTQCGNIQDHTCNYENSKCTVCGKELPAVGISAENCTWEELKAIAEAGKGDDYFNLGDTKTITTTDGKTIVMEIVAFNADTKADGTGTAGITWISKGAVATRLMNDIRTNANGWKDSDLRAWLQADFYSTLPSDTKSVITSVNKTYFDKTTRSTLSCEDNVWIPSYRELFGFTTYKEDSGPVYTNYFTDNSACVKYDSEGNGAQWWLRTANWNSEGSFFYVTTSGVASYNSADSSITDEVVFGFCI